MCLCVCMCVCRVCARTLQMLWVVSAFQFRLVLKDPVLIKGRLIQSEIITHTHTHTHIFTHTHIHTHTHTHTHTCNADTSTHAHAEEEARMGSGVGRPCKGVCVCVCVAVLVIGMLLGGLFFQVRAVATCALCHVDYVMRVHLLCCCSMCADLQLLNFKQQRLQSATDSISMPDFCDVCVCVCARAASTQLQQLP